MDTKNRLFVLIFLAIIMSLFTIQAAVEITEESIKFDADYSDFDDEDQNTIRESVEFTIRNTESTEVTVNTNIVGLSQRYNVPSINQVTIPSGESRLISFNIDIPHLQNSGERQIGTIELKSTSGVLYDSAALIQDTKSMLTIEKLRVDYDDNDGDAQEDNFDDNDNKFKLDHKVKAGSEITLKFENIKNLFDKDYDKDDSVIDRIVLKLDPSDNDLFEDFEEEHEIDDLDADDGVDLTINLKINEDIDDDDYTIEIEVEGEDGQGAKHVFRKDLEFEIERSNEDVRITKFEITPEDNIQSCETNVRIDVEIKNFGKGREQQAALLLFSDSLGIIENIPNIQLNRHSKSDNNFKRTFNFNFDKKNVKEGKHRIDVSAFINLDEQSDLKNKFITITSCKLEETQKIEVADDLKVNEEKNTQEAVSATVKNEKSLEENKISSSKIVQTIEDPYTSEDVLVALIVISIILIMAVIVIFTMILVKK